MENDMEHLSMGRNRTLGSVWLFYKSTPQAKTRVQNQVLGEDLEVEVECVVTYQVWIQMLTKQLGWLLPAPVQLIAHSESTIRAQVAFPDTTLIIPGIPLPQAVILSGGAGRYSEITNQSMGECNKWTFLFTLVSAINISFVCLFWFGNFCEKCWEALIYAFQQCIRYYYIFSSCLFLSENRCVCVCVCECLIFPLTCKLQKNKAFVYVIHPCILSSLNSSCNLPGTHYLFVKWNIQTYASGITE